MKVVLGVLKLFFFLKRRVRWSTCNVGTVGGVYIYIYIYILKTYPILLFLLKENFNNV